MRSIIPLLGLLVFSIPGVATAQGFQGIEIFGGYAYLGNNLSSTYSPFYLSAVPFGNNFPLNGWQASLTENATDWLGLTQEFGGSTGQRGSRVWTTISVCFQFFLGRDFPIRASRE